VKRILPIDLSLLGDRNPVDLTTLSLHILSDRHEHLVDPIS